MILNVNPSDDGHDAVADYNLEDDGFTNVWWNVSLVYGKQSSPALQRDTRLILQLDRYLGGQFALSSGQKALTFSPAQFNPPKTNIPLIRTPSMANSMFVSAGFDYYIFHLSYIT